MKKDDALALRERLRSRALEVASKQGFPGLSDDGKLFHDEVDDLARWCQRLSLPGSWPHGAPGEGAPACPGLRYEIWFFPGKPQDETLLFAVLCSGDHGLDRLQRHLAPTFASFIEGGKYARRYRPLEPAYARLDPAITGVCRRMPVAKAETTLTQLLEDTLKPLDAAFSRFEGAPEAAGAFRAACGAFDPLAALKARFKGP